MKKNHICLVLAVIAVTGFWAGRLAWRAHRKLVTLHVRNMPLADVVRSLERQTWEKIRFDRTITSKVTLNVQDAPLDKVLDIVADRAGARWQRVFAVGTSDVAVRELESSLDGGEKPAATTWTNLAPQFHGMEDPDLPDGGPDPGPDKPGRIIRRVLPGGGETGGGRGARLGMGGARMMTFGPGGIVDVWSSERLVLETDLLPRLGSAIPSDANEQTATQVASAVHGKSRLYYAIEKSPYENAAFGSGQKQMLATRGPGPQPAGPPPDMVNPGAGLAQWRRQQRLRELSRSPEEQVERARQNQENKMRLEINEDVNKPGNETQQTPNP